MSESKSLIGAAGGKADAQLFGLRCRVNAANNAPSEWDIVIIGAGVEFMFREGGSETDGNPNLNIQSGQSQQVADSDPAKCVRKLKGLLRYRRNRTGDEGIIEGESDDVPGTECAAEWTMSIGPALTVKQDAKGDVSAFAARGEQVRVIKHAEPGAAADAAPKAGPRC